MCDAQIALDEAYRMQVMPFCGARITYTPCVPREQSLPPSKDWPEGRWTEHTVLAKDRYVAEQTTALVASRKAEEGRRDRSSQYVHEQRFRDNPDCENAFVNYMCWINFPRCDGNGESLVTCRSACENLMKACNVPESLRR